VAPPTSRCGAYPRAALGADPWAPGPSLSPQRAERGSYRDIRALNAATQREARATTRLYLITPPAFDPDRFAKELEEALAAGDVACLQLRLKEVQDDAIRRATRVLKPIAEGRGVAFIMNDRPDLAAELDCDGVHVGEEDMPYSEARRLLGPDRIVGVTCGASRDRAITAAEAGTDYVAFGAFFPSTTKVAKHHADPELIRDWSETTVVPCCAIGGITQKNCGPLVEAGADFLAVIGAIWSHPKGPRAAVAAFNEVFAHHGRAYLGARPEMK